jgi:hypothetical protein
VGPSVTPTARAAARAASSTGARPAEPSLGQACASATPKAGGAAVLIGEH